MTEQLFQKLEQLIPLSNLEKELIAKYLTKKHLKKGEVFIEGGKISKEGGFIVSGIFRYYFKNQDGNEITTMFVKNNDFVTRVSSFFNKLPSDRTIVAEIDSTIITTTYDDYNNIIKKVPQFETAIKFLAATALRKSSQIQRSYIDNEGPERYKLFLKQFPEISREIKLGHVASYLGISAPTLSRIRQRIKKDSKLKV